jgi:hypothetical protein
MPGKFIDEVHIFQCGTHSDGSAIMCSEITFAKVPFTLPADAPNEVGWQEAGMNDVHLPLASLIETMQRYGITVSYDEQELERLLGPRPIDTAD